MQSVVRSEVKFSDLLGRFGVLSENFELSAISYKNIFFRMLKGMNSAVGEYGRLDKHLSRKV